MPDSDARDDTEYRDDGDSSTPPRASRRKVLGAMVGTGIATFFTRSVSAFDAAMAPSTHVFEGLTNGRKSWTIDNGRLQINVLSGGGFIGELSLSKLGSQSGVNLMRVPHYDTIDPHTFELARHGSMYGSGMQRKLMAGYMGHFVAFPHFGASSDPEFAQDYAQHGETIAVEWAREDLSEENSLVMTVELPLTHYRFSRSISLPPGQPVAYVRETAENALAFDRPFQWVEHITFGPPFVRLGTATVDTSPAFKVEGRDRFDSAGLRLSSITIDTAGPFTGISDAWLLQREDGIIYVTMCNPGLGILVGYVFEGAASLWLLDWQENHRNQAPPWAGKGVARGLCVGNSFIGGLQNAVRQGEVGGVPVYDWFPARGTVSRNYLVFAIQVDPDFKGVAKLTSEPGLITVVERGTGRAIPIPHVSDRRFFGALRSKTLPKRNPRILQRERENG